MSDKIKFGLIGCGIFGERVLIPAFKNAKNAECIAITKRDFEAAIEKARKYDIPLAYGSGDIPQMLHNDEIEAIYVASPNKFHHKDTIASLNAGKHVILEKPMALNSSQCKEIIDASKESKGKLMIAQCFRYSSVIRYIKKLIDDGKLGNLVMGTCDFMSQGRKSARKWKYNKEMSGGGAAFDLAVHTIDILRYLNPDSISSVTHLHWPDPLPENFVDEFSTFNLNFKNGFVGRATGSYYGPRHSSIQIYGTNGMVRCFDFHKLHTKAEIFREIGDKSQIYTMEVEDHYTLQLDDFAQCIKNNTPVPVTGEDGLINQKIIDLVNK